MSSPLDDIIARHATPAPADLIPSFRPFTDSDWNAYAGCESEDPQIAGAGSLELVLDGSTLNATLHFDETDQAGCSGLIFAHEFETPAVAMAIGRSILFNPDPDAYFLEAFLGEPVGDF